MQFMECMRGTTFACPVGRPDAGGKVASGALFDDLSEKCSQRLLQAYPGPMVNSKSTAREALHQALASRAPASTQ
jgi:hypothetical protein